MIKTVTILRIAGFMALAYFYVKLFSIFPDEYFYLFTYLIQFLILGAIIFKILAVYWKCFIYYMLNDTYRGYNKNIEKPRLLFHLIFFPISIFFLLLIKNFTDSNGNLKGSTNIFNIIDFPNIMIITILLFGFIFSVLVMFTTWTKKFENSLIPSIKSHLKKNNPQDFENNYTNTQLEKIFEKLVEHDFIEVIKGNDNIIDKNLFVEILREGILPAEPIFKLHMDNIQTKDFHKLFKSKCKKLTMPKFLKIFIIKSETATPASISSSKSKSLNGAKKKELIESIFLG